MTEQLRVASFQELVKELWSPSRECALANDGEGLGLERALCEEAHRNSIYTTPWIFSCAGHPASIFCRALDTYLSLAVSSGNAVSLLFKRSSSDELLQRFHRVTFVLEEGARVLSQTNAQQRAYDFAEVHDLDFCTRFGIAVARDARRNARLTQSGAMGVSSCGNDNFMSDLFFGRLSGEYDTADIEVGERELAIRDTTYCFAKSGNRVNLARGFREALALPFAKRVRSSYEVKAKQESDDSPAAIKVHVEDAGETLDFEVP